MVSYPQHAGGLNNVATVLGELAEAIHPQKLLEAAKLCPVGWSQRLGHLFELTGAAELAESIEPFVRDGASSYIPLRRAYKVGGARRDARWKVIVNVEVEPDE